MQTPDPTTEHHWLQQLVGDWQFVHECSMGPDQPSSKSTGTQSTRALGKFWTLGEMSVDSSEGSASHSIITLGFDPMRGKFVGTFVSSCMTYLWLYEGSLDEAGRVLTLDAEGPSFLGEGAMGHYQDIIEFVDADTYLFSSRIKQADGTWLSFMSGTFTRKA